MLPTIGGFIANFRGVIWGVGLLGAVIPYVSLKVLKSSENNWNIICCFLFQQRLSLS